jgi:O-antigen biosynthesis protein WbqV
MMLGQYYNIFFSIISLPTRHNTSASVAAAESAYVWTTRTQLPPSAVSGIAAKLRARFRRMLRRDAIRLLTLDLALGAAAVCFAYFLRFGLSLDGGFSHLIAFNTAIYLVLCAVALIGCGFYDLDWRYPSIYDVFRVPRALILVFSTQLIAIHQIDALAGSSRLALVIAIMLHGCSLFAVRIAFRLNEALCHASFVGRDGALLPILLIGASGGADQYVRALQRDERARFHPVGILAHSGAGEACVGSHVRGVPVLGTIADLETVATRLRAQGREPRRLVFTESLSLIAEEEAAAVIHLADRFGVKVCRAPRPTDLRHPAATDARSDLQPVEVTDLLERPQVALDREAVRDVITGRRVLVTGAGGSIGAELAAQLATLDPAALVLVDHGEFNLFSVERTVTGAFPDVPCFAAICDVRDAASVRALFRRHRPEFVFHAAALKHVPLVEMNPIEGILTNAIGSRNVADAARDFGAAAFVQVSTDKAVNTTNVMGASKRIGELYCQALDIESQSRGEGGPRFMTVRFGNVLGTSGSLVPLFQEQLARGGPLTVTDAEMRRYFMSIGEAVALTLQSSCFALQERRGQGRIFVLEMGEPVRILDIARRMIVLAGLTPNRDVKIEIVGRRPGEKLSEELFDETERLAELGVPGVVCAVPSALPLAFMADALDRLEAAARARDGGALLEIVQELLPAYRPSEVAAAMAVSAELAGSSGSLS